MRVLISAAYGSKGDVLPFYGIALELRKRGHDVYLFIGEAQYSFISSQKESSEINVVEIKAEFNGYVLILCPSLVITTIISLVNLSISKLANGDTYIPICILIWYHYSYYYY